MLVTPRSFTRSPPTPPHSPVRVASPVRPSVALLCFFLLRMLSFLVVYIASDQRFRVQTRYPLQGSRGPSPRLPLAKTTLWVPSVHFKLTQRSVCQRAVDQASRQRWWIHVR